MAECRHSDGEKALRLFTHEGVETQYYCQATNTKLMLNALRKGR
jgi:hypothetical protein